MHAEPLAPPYLGADLMAPQGQMFIYVAHLSLPLASGYVLQPHGRH